MFCSINNTVTYMGICSRLLWAYRGIIGVEEDFAKWHNHKINLRYEKDQQEPLGSSGVA